MIMAGGSQKISLPCCRRWSVRSNQFVRDSVQLVRKLFHGVPLDLWSQAITAQQTTTEADFLVKALRLDPGSHLLDLPCGNGRLAFELAKRGYRVTGVDISEECIEEARLSGIRI